jgi:hypothetical protein
MTCDSTYVFYIVMDEYSTPTVAVGSSNLMAVRSKSTLERRTVVRAESAAGAGFW